MTSLEWTAERIGAPRTPESYFARGQRLSYCVEPVTCMVAGHHYAVSCRAESHESWTVVGIYRDLSAAKRHAEEHAQQ